SSTHVGRYAPQLKVSFGSASVGTMIKNLSNHIPTMTRADAIVVPVTLLNLRNARSGAGIAKQQMIVPQNKGENAPLIFERNTAISPGSLPYHVVRYSPNVK